MVKITTLRLQRRESGLPGKALHFLTLPPAPTALCELTTRWLGLRWRVNLNVSCPIYKLQYTAVYTQYCSRGAQMRNMTYEFGYDGRV